MRILLPLLVLVCLIGCGTKVGSSAPLPGVAVYPGAKITTNGENPSVIGMTLDTPDSVDKVVAFYANELGVPVPPKGVSLDKVRNGHRFLIIVVPNSKGQTTASIVEHKSPN